jgi:FtsP/CotA-like multicopper oxidase with cupredoxin domain
MALSRRAFLKNAGASLGVFALPPALARAANPTAVSLRASSFAHRIRPSGPETQVWGFNGSLPGPILRFAQGERVRIAVRNDLPQPTTVHWHGLRVPNAMDGVPQVTQLPIPMGGHFDYEFALDDAGSYWYHPHQMSFEQVARGLYGWFIVDEARPVEVDRELAWVLSDFKLGADNRQVEDFGNIRDFGSGGRIGNTIALNGRSTAAPVPVSVRAGERIRLRILNAASARIFLLDFTGHRPLVVAHDGQPVAPHPLPHDLLALGPGMRADLVLDCIGAPGKRFAVWDRRDQGSEIARLVYTGQKPVRTRPLPPPPMMAPNPIAEPDLARATQHYIVFQGGFLGKPAIGMVDGKPLKVPEIMEKEKLAWTMNYTAAHEHSMMHVPFLHADKGEHIILKMINETDFEHPMHLHGHTFRVLAVNDRESQIKELRDTVLLGPHGSAEVAFVADNPGEWMFHCHILDHAAGGMMGTIAVGL